MELTTVEVVSLEVSVPLIQIRLFVTLPSVEKSNCTAETVFG